MATQTQPELTHDAPPVVRDVFFIGGEWVAPAGVGAEARA